MRDASELEQLIPEFSGCTTCRREIPKIGELPPSEFKFHWKPYYRGAPPFRYVFLTWEPPSLKQSGAQGTDPEEGWVNVPLQFFIREFLLRHLDDGFLITNMAKCSLKADSTCQQTRPQRWRKCYPYLKREFLIARADGPELVVISVGRKPKEFLEPHLLQELSIQRIYRIMHYSGQCGPRFSTFAQQRSEEFQLFREEFGSRYEEFIRTGDNSKFASHCAGLEVPVSDFQRMFKWQHELREAGLLSSSRHAQPEPDAGNACE